MTKPKIHSVSMTPTPSCRLMTLLGRSEELEAGVLPTQLAGLEVSMGSSKHTAGQKANTEEMWVSKSLTQIWFGEH